MRGRSVERPWWAWPSYPLPAVHGLVFERCASLPGPEPAQEPRFIFERIHELTDLIGEHNRAWQEWFKLAGIQPRTVLYEKLSEDPIEVTYGILNFLGLKLPADREISVQHRRLADELNSQWIQRYRAGGQPRRTHHRHRTRSPGPG